MIIRIFLMFFAVCCVGYTQELEQGKELHRNDAALTYPDVSDESMTRTVAIPFKPGTRQIDYPEVFRLGLESVKTWFSTEQGQRIKRELSYVFFGVCGVLIGCFIVELCVKMVVYDVDKWHKFKDHLERTRKANVETLDYDNPWAGQSDRNPTYWEETDTVTDDINRRNYFDTPDHLDFADTDDYLASRRYTTHYGDSSYSPPSAADDDKPLDYDWEES